MGGGGWGDVLGQGDEESLISLSSTPNIFSYNLSSLLLGPQVGQSRIGTQEGLS